MTFRCITRTAVYSCLLLIHTNEVDTFGCTVAIMLSGLLLFNQKGTHLQCAKRMFDGTDDLRFD